MELLQTIALLCGLNMPAQNQMRCQVYLIDCVERHVKQSKFVSETDALKICIKAANYVAQGEK